MRKDHAWALIGLGGLSLLMASCSQTSYSVGETMYLDGMAPPPRTFTPGQGVVDTVSYWEGDGVGGPSKVVISLGDQTASFYRADTLVGVSRISTGRSEFPTPTGSFRISQKNVNHRSSAYGNFVDSAGNVVVEDVDSRLDKAPPGSRFEGASMPFFMRFNQGVGMHAGFLPGYPASHGCVRMPDWMAEKFFQNVEIGTPVIVEP